MMEEGLWTVTEAAELTGYSEKAIRRRIERGTLKTHAHGRRGIRVSTNDLRDGGLLEVPETDEDRAIQRLIQFLSQRPEQPFTTYDLSAAAGVAAAVADPNQFIDAEGTDEEIATARSRALQIGYPHYLKMSRQKCETTLSTLRALGLVEKTREPPPRGTTPRGSGRPRNAWRWIGGRES